MLLGGLWHGAAWNFVLWGAWHGGGLMAERVLGNRQSPIANRQWGRLAAWLATLLFVFYGWLLFRARSLDQIVAMTRALGNFSAPAWLGSYAINLVAFAAPLALMQLWQQRRGVLAPLTLPGWARGALEGLLLLGIVVFWDKASVPFIYFQF
jgi:alginate O-acetyltransferase complex protein AlgI